MTNTQTGASIACTTTVFTQSAEQDFPELTEKETLTIDVGDQNEPSTILRLN